MEVVQEVYLEGKNVAGNLTPDSVFASNVNPITSGLLLYRMIDEVKLQF